MKNVHTTGAVTGLQAALLLLSACGSPAPRSGEEYLRQY